MDKGTYQPWDGIKAEVSKASPDQSAVHVMGSDGKKRGKLKKCNK